MTTYYPGTRALSDARAVNVRSGKDVTNVKFSLASGPLANVTIDAIDSHGLPLGREVSAILNLRSDVYFSSSARQTNRHDNGPLMFSEVPHGNYSLIVSTSYRQEESAYINLNVDGDVTVKVQTNAGATVSGRFVVQGAPRDANTTAPNVDVRATRPPFKYGPTYTKDASAHPQGTDRFTLTGLRGPVVLQATMMGASLVSISRAGGEDLAGKAIEFTGRETIDDLLVVFSTEQAEAEVTLDGLREPADPEKVLVILFSEDATGWHFGSMNYTVIEASTEMPRQPTAGGARRPGRSFTFGLGSVVPGRYLIAAVPNPGVMDPADRDFLERLRPIAVPVTLVAGKPAKVELRVSR